MKISVVKKDFLKSWAMAERLAGFKTSMNIFSAVFVDADYERTELRSTNLRTSITCKAEGVTVIEPGQALIPLKHVSELFNKAGAEEFIINIGDQGRASMTAGRGKYRFSTYSVSDFPKLPASDSASHFFTAAAAALSSAIVQGALCASVKDVSPAYLSSVYFDVDDGVLTLVSTDKRRLALSRSDCSPSVTGAALLPCSAVREVQRILGALEAGRDVEVFRDDAQVYFAAKNIEFSVRTVGEKFPNYKNILPQTARTTMLIDQAAFVAALDRVRVVVGDTNRIVELTTEGDGNCVLSGRAPEFGEAVEVIDCSRSGEPIKIAFNINFMLDAASMISSRDVKLLFNGSNSHVCVKNDNSDDFISLVAPVELGEEDIPAAEEDAEEAVS
jgi:DNA polymerase-3 subunit beta